MTAEKPTILCLLQQAGYRVIVAASPADGIRLFSSEPDNPITASVGSESLRLRQGFMD
jgi:hypothetical protein